MTEVGRVTSEAHGGGHKHERTPHDRKRANRHASQRPPARRHECTLETDVVAAYESVGTQHHSVGGHATAERPAASVLASERQPATVSRMARRRLATIATERSERRRHRATAEVPLLATATMPETTTAVVAAIAPSPAAEARPGHTP